MANLTNKHSLNPSEILRQLTQLAQKYSIDSWCLAYSGGVDSQVLLHLLQSSDLPVYAIYIDHGLQAQSTDWARHCEQQCQQYNIPFQCVAVNAHPEKGESPEAAARTARYQAFAKIIGENSCLLTAQHLDDQAETVLLQLLRGAGAAGLAAMPAIIPFAEGWHFRPLLEISQSSILHYARQYQLIWIEDPSNLSQQYDRNFLRLSVIPGIQQRWPALNRTLSQFAEQQAENMRLLEQLAEQDLQTVIQNNKCLHIPGLKQLDSARLRNVLRYWLKCQQSSMPSRAVLQQIISQIQSPSNDTHVLISWANTEVRRFRDGLYCIEKRQHDPSQVLQFDKSRLLHIDSLQQTFSLEKQANAEANTALSNAITEMQLTVRFRQGGEKIQPAGRKGHRDLKSLFQEADIPAWERDRVPLLYADDKLVAVVGYWLAEEYAVDQGGVLPVLKKN